jgi:hypothetical protein
VWTQGARNPSTGLWTCREKPPREPAMADGPDIFPRWMPRSPRIVRRRTLPPKKTYGRTNAQAIRANTAIRPAGRCRVRARRCHYRSGLGRVSEQLLQINKAFANGRLQRWPDATPAPHPVGRAGGLPASSPWSCVDPRIFYRDLRAEITPSAAKSAEFWSYRTHQSAGRRSRLCHGHGEQRDNKLYQAFTRPKMLTTP